MKKILLGTLIVAFMAMHSFSAEILCGGNVPLINTMVGVSALSLDLSANGTDVNVATYIINNNSPDFVVTWSFQNSGKFINNDGAEIPWTGASIEELFANGAGGYVMGTGLGHSFTVGAPLGILAAGADAQVAGSVGAGSVVWTSGAQSTATVMDQITMTASWTSDNTVLTGLYTEKITYGIVAVL